MSLKLTKAKLLKYALNNCNPCEEIFGKELMPIIETAQQIFKDKIKNPTEIKPIEKLNNNDNIVKGKYDK